MIIIMVFRVIIFQKMIGIIIIGILIFHRVLGLHIPLIIDIESRTSGRSIEIFGS